MKNPISVALLMAAFFVAPVSAQNLAKEAGLLDNLFDAGVTPVDARPLTRSAAPKILEAGVQGEPRGGAFAEQQKLLQIFVRTYSTRILQVPGVLGVYVGLDCNIKEPHVHIRPHMPAVVVRLDGTLHERLVYQHLVRALPQLNQVVYRLDVDPEGEPRADEVRCWLLEGC